MSIDRLANPAAVGQAGGASGQAKADGTERAKLALVAAEFESMLLVQMLRDMRSMGKWDHGEGGDTLGAETFYQTIDVELASHLAKARGFGLGRQLLDAFDGSHPSAPSEMPVVPSSALVPRGRAAAPGHAASHAASGHGRRPVVESVAGSGRVGSEEETGLALPSGTVTSGFGWRRDPLHGAARFHAGIDVRAAYGEDVRSAGEGRVVFSGQQGGYGTTVLVEHANGVQTRYAHLSASLVEVGEQVAAGHVLGRAGRSGRATGTHLHFEVLADGRPLDPQRVGLKAEGLIADLTSRTPIGSQESAAHDHQD